MLALRHTRSGDDTSAGERFVLSVYLDSNNVLRRLHIHPTTGHPEGIPEIHLVYRSPTASFNVGTSLHITSAGWRELGSYICTSHQLNLLQTRTFPTSVSRLA